MLWSYGRIGRGLACMASAGSLILISPTPAAAHTGTGLPGGFLSGFGHPFAGLDHCLAMVCVGLWGAVLGRPLLYALPVIFPAVMVVGAALAMLGAPLPYGEFGIALSVLVLGGCIALQAKAPVWAASLIVALFAVFHGYAHGKELPSAADPVGYSAGFVLATGLLHVMGIGLGSLTAQPQGRTAVRALGAVIGAGGLWFLMRAVAA
jgi:urease accessory protein